jgi:hypothetical protein
MAEGRSEASAMGQTDIGSPPASTPTGWPICVESGPPIEPRPLDEEIDFYLSHVEGWGQEEGRHVLILGRQLHGFYATRDEALREGSVGSGGPRS